MLIPDSEEVIARFIGMFGVLDFDPKLHSKLVGADGRAQGVEPAPSDAMAWGGLTAPYDPRLSDPQLRYDNDAFVVEKVRSQPPPAHKLDPPHGSQDFAAHPPPLSHAMADEPYPHAGQAMHSPPDPSAAYHGEGADSLLAEYRQTNVLDDRDTFSMDGHADPLAVVDAVTREFQQMVETAVALRSLPGIPAGTAELEATLTIAPPHGADLAAAADENPEAAPVLQIATGSGDGWTATSMTLTAVHAADQPIVAPLELQGIFVDGARSETLPPLGDLLAQLRSSSIADAGQATLDTGSNALTTSATIRNFGELGFVTTVMGNWYETNSIRQFNIHSDVDGIAGIPDGRMLTGGTQAMNVAEFARIDATPTNAFLLPDFGFLPSDYKVDVVEGNLQITSFLSQLNFMMDGDQVALTSTRSSIGLSTGGNAATDSAHLLKMLGSYDLVVIGGSVFEGNFIQQMNVLSDNDRLVSALTGPGADALSGSTGGNFLLNAAKITNVGGLGDFAPLTADMSKLVSLISGRGSIDDLGVGSDLGFLGHSQIRVLYLTGNVYEMNVVSQMNVLDDSDTVFHAGSLARGFVDGAGPDAAWTISTGHNALVNAATITDVDDAGFKRFMDGQYYSSSMLVQADLVGRGQDVISFDPQKLVPELVAFMHDDALPGGHHDAGPSILHHDASAEGVGSMLS